jgi:ferrochelatase
VSVTIASCGQDGCVDYDAFLLLSFGGPESPDEVMPFLANVTRDRGVPQHRMAEVAEHYFPVGGVSPINARCRDLIEALRPQLGLPIYWGNRNWHPLLTDTLTRMRDDGVRRAIAFVTSPYGSYSSCRQYLDDIAAARAAVGRGAPAVDKLRHYHDHPGFVQPHADAVRAALPPGGARVVFTAHSIPSTMDAASGPEGRRYTAQLHETAELVAAGAGVDDRWDLVWQSRSGPPHVPWLAPDINDHLALLAGRDESAVVVSPIGFICDHMEVVWDLDTEAAQTARRLGLTFARAATPGTDPRFVSMIVDLVAERTKAAPQQRLGRLPVWDRCPADCCVHRGQAHA